MKYALICSLATAVSALAASDPDFQFDVQHVAGGYSVTLTNQTGSEILVPGFDYTDPKSSGYYVYLFDPVEKELRRPKVLVFSTRPRRDDLDRHVLRPGGKQTFDLFDDDIAYFFGVESGCYYVVGTFRLRTHGRMLRSNVSKPHYACFKYKG